MILLTLRRVRLYDQLPSLSEVFGDIRTVKADGVIAA